MTFMAVVQVQVCACVCVYVAFFGEGSLVFLSSEVSGVFLNVKPLHGFASGYTR